MGKMEKVLRYFALVLALVFIIVFTSFQSRLIKKSGSYQLNILQSDVNVYFDNYGIPHIESQNAEDGYRVLGYIIASERLFQMDLLRRIVSGRLSEIFGDKTINADIMLRKLQLKQTAVDYFKESKNRLNPKILTQIRAFLEGVHYYIEHQSLPVEFDLLGYTPEKFDEADVLATTYYMAMTFAEGLIGDVVLSEAMERLPDDKMEILRAADKVDFDYFPGQKLVKANLLKNLNRALSEIEEYLPLFYGSNSWVLAPHRSQSGKALLANDPHIGVGNPHIFYEAHLKFPGLELYGHFLPTIPFAALGHTDQAAWAVTMSEIDDVTVYLEKFNPENPTQVMYKNEWVETQQKTEVIKVKGKKDIDVKVVKTPHGPLLDGTMFGVEGKSLSLHWSVYHPENDSLQTLYELPLARTVEQFKQAVSHAASPGLNISWVNAQGDIAWWVMGKYPKLPADKPNDLVLHGWDGKSDIEAYTTVDENPHEVNPESGVIVSANYRPQNPEYAHFNGYWQPGERYFRIEQLLKSKEKWSVEDMKGIQLDNFVPTAAKIREHLLPGLDQSKLTEFEKMVLAEYQTWDGHAHKDSVGASIYYMFNRFLAVNAFEDELGKEDYEKLDRTVLPIYAFHKLVLNLNHSFWDNVKTDHVENGKDIILYSFKESVQFLKENLGERIARWKWGRLHQAKYVHPLGKVKPLNLVYNIGPVPANGGRTTINKMGFSKSKTDFTITSAPATRRIIDMADTQNSLGIVPTGNSGNPFSEHFSDQLKLYHNGNYRLQDMNWDRIRHHSKLLFKRN